MKSVTRTSGQRLVVVLAALIMGATLVDSARAGIGFKVERLTNINDEPGGDSFNTGGLSRGEPIFFEYGGDLIFYAYAPATGVELYKTDGANTALVADILPGPDSSSPGRDHFRYQELGGDLYFFANGIDGVGNAVGRELHRLNPTTGQVELVIDGAPGPADGTSGGAYLPDEQRVYNGQLYFEANGQLHETNGTTVSSLVYDGEPLMDPYFGAEFNGELYFRAFRDSVSGPRLYHTNGDSITEVPAVFADGTPMPGGFYPATRREPFAEYQGRLYFEGRTTGIHGSVEFELFSTDGTSFDYHDVQSGPFSSYPHNYKAVGDKLLFIASGEFDGTYTGREVFSYDAETEAFELLDGYDPPGDSFRHDYAGHNYDPIPVYDDLAYLYYQGEELAFSTDGDTLTLIPDAKSTPLGHIGDRLLFYGQRGEVAFVTHDSAATETIEKTDTGDTYYPRYRRGVFFEDLYFEQGFTESADGITLSIIVTDGDTLHAISDAPVVDFSPLVWFNDKLIFVGDGEEGRELYAVTIVPLIGDANNDGRVDGVDYIMWANNFGDDPADDPPGSPANGDFNGDGVVDGNDYIVWAEHYGETGLPSPETAATAVPEPGGLALLLTAVVACCWRRRRGTLAAF